MTDRPRMHSGETAAVDHPNAGAATEAGKSPVSGRGRRVAGQDPAKRDQIIEGAKRCFFDLGFEACSMNEVAAEAGVSKGTLYVYFEDKEALFAAICDRERGRTLNFARQGLDQAGTVEEALQTFGTVLTLRLTSTYVIRAMRMVLGVAERMPMLALRFFGSEPFSGVQILKDYLDSKVALGELEIADTELAGRQFIDLAMAGLFKRRLFGNMAEEPDPVQVAAIVRSAVEMFLGYYRPRNRG
ncbi:MAG: TetR/AcrR family transcriptional regulator [Devosia sp.]|nr:TetR/AcrR family transcriptional regulator [Devosia sp.]